MRSPTQQYSFTAGVLDDTLEARSDLRAYYAGGREIVNMQSLPQGGLRTRPGLAFVAELPEAAGGLRLASFAFSTEQKYLLVFTDRKLHVYKDGVKQTTLVTPWRAAQLKALDWTQSLDTMIAVHPEVAPQKIMRQGAHNAWALSPLEITNTPRYDFGAGLEAVWSTKRGWPRSVYFYEGRMYFGGSRSRPQTLWGSNSNNFFDFKVTTSGGAPLDDSSVEMTLDNDRVCAIEQLYALDDLYAFTSGGLFVQTESPVTPGNFYFSRNSELPAANIRPAELDGSILYIKRGADGAHLAPHELVYDDVKQIYTTQDLALLASSLLREPVAMAAHLGSESDRANHLYVVNGDGSVAVLNTRKAQQITGWTLFKTAGVVRDGVAVGGTVYFLVTRRLAGRERHFLERLDSQHLLDASQRLTNSSAKSLWDGLEFLEGQEVRLYGDSVPLGKAVVRQGEVRLPHPVRSLEVGLAFDWVVETLPLETQLADGTLIGKRHRITQASLRVKDTRALQVNGRPVVFKAFGDKVLDTPPPAFTGLKTLRFLGWSGGPLSGGGATIRITGPSAATLLAVTAEVAQ